LNCKFSKIKQEMFTGIIETVGRVQEIQKDQDNVHITVASSITGELKIDQSVSHNGVCLTVVNVVDDVHTVVAIAEVSPLEFMFGVGAAQRCGGLPRVSDFGGNGSMLGGFASLWCIDRTRVTTGRGGEGQGTGQ
jgi:hypothetical protein